MSTSAIMSEIEPGGELEFSRETSPLVEFDNVVLFAPKAKKRTGTRKLVKRKRMTAQEHRELLGVVDAPSDDVEAVAPATVVVKAPKVSEPVAKPEREQIVVPDASQVESAAQALRDTLDEVTAMRERRAEIERLAAINEAQQAELRAAQMAQEAAERQYQEEYALMMLLAESL